MSADRSCDAWLALAKEHLSAQFEVYEQDGACFVVTPFLRHDNDPVTLRISGGNGGSVLVTDDGATIDYLRLSGYAVRRNASFKKHMRSIQQSFSVNIEDEEILLEVPDSDFATALATVARAAQHVSYLIYRRRPRSTVRFEERVEIELIGVGAVYARDITVQGQTGPRRFSFFVNGAGSTLLQPLSGTSREALTSKVERLAFRIMDVQRASSEYRFFPILDDTGRTADLWSAAMLGPLEAYSDGVIRWSSDPRSRLTEALRIQA